MLCSHQSTQSRHTGNMSVCLLCEAPIIFTGKKWEWEHSIDLEKRRKLRQIYQVDRITGVHDGN